MERIVLFAGGPLHGKTTVTDSTYGVYVMDTASVCLHPPPDLTAPLPGPMLYHMSRHVICGRIIWIGHLGGQPDEDAVWDALASDAAKAAAAPHMPYVPAHP